MKSINKKRPFTLHNLLRSWHPRVTLAEGIIIVAIVMIVLFGVAGFNIYINRIRAGYIIDKRYEPAHYEEYTDYVKSGDTRIPVYRHRYISDNWSFVIRDNGETARWDVYESTYNKYSIGDWFDVDVEGEKALWRWIISL